MGLFGAAAATVPPVVVVWKSHAATNACPFEWAVAKNKKEKNNTLRYCGKIDFIMCFSLILQKYTIILALKATQVN